MITPAIAATLPVFQYVSERDQSLDPELEDDSELEEEIPEPTPEFTLQPRTYTPVPPQPPTPVLESPAPEVRHKTSLRQRFSLKRKDVAAEKKTVVPPMPTRPKQERPPTSSSQRRIVDSVASPAYSRGPDSAYCSDNDRVIAYSSSQEFAPPRHEFGSGYVSSPRSDQQHFHPVRASPHSPLQRPWTAGPTAAQNQRTYSTSTTNLSMMSNMTTVTENGVKVKKKRGAFGWLKNAFALSEEEKAEFEKKRRGQSTSSYAPERRPPMFQDGRRITFQDGRRVR